MAIISERAKVELQLQTDIEMLLVIEDRVRGRTFNSIIRHATANNKYMKFMIKLKNCHILNIET